MATPEQMVRQLIDAQLTATGSVIQDRDKMNLGVGLGVAVREYALGRDAFSIARPGRTVGIEADDALAMSEQTEI
jgi:hypothetical protein